MISIETTIFNKKFSNCLMNASGVKCMTIEELSNLKNSESGTWITKSCTLSPREGNPSPRYVDLKLGSINSMGLPNLGFEFYLDYVLTEHEMGNDNLFFSIAGLTLENNIKMLTQIENSDFQGLVELNLSCPNIPGKPQTGYDFERTEEVLKKVFSFYTKPLGVKLPPYFDMVHFEMIAEIINKYPIQFVTCINSIGNALYIEDESVVIKPKSGFGGLGGAYVKPTALANVRMFYKLLRKNISIIGCGGVETGRDVFEHILCGASMVQVGTQLMKDDVKIFSKLSSDLKEIMKSKNYTSLSDFKGKLKEL
ncbi:dihydroorotate dehydrogenase (fumarate) [Apibacter mensalis]|uniref:dihydroorotate oxidase (fumarate) n=1 Tax=Apibacter mensalis TaxID=1586267 RepID=A0A0X3AS23_9FLAO|nr:dihydroorotate oxidase [Apibacter mensalis]CVK16678.1 dihydroorotate dehydrogenase (fumarate) [Apibacter mensalis]